MGRKVTKWTPDRLAELRRLVAEGLTDVKIAEAMDVSKSAVDQQVYRLGLRLRGYAKIVDLRHCRNAFYAARKRAGLTRQEAEQKSGISIHMIQQYEQGKAKPARLVLWQSLAQTYGCTIGDLLGQEVLDKAQR